MPQASLHACLIGAGSFGAHALAALCNSQMIELTGLSDRDGRVAETASAEAGCPGYSDHRRVLVEASPEAVFLAVPPAPAAELAALAARRGLHLWRQVPLSRSLAEAVQLCRRMDQAKRKFAVGTVRRFSTSYRLAKQWIGRLGKPHFARAHYQYDLGPDLGWHGDKAAGGGALIELGYHMLDLMIWLLGMPDSVYSIVGSGQRVRAGEDQPLYDSDDTAVCVMRYPGKLTAAVTVSRCFGPLSEGLTVYGQAGTLSAGPDQCVLRDRDDAIVEQFAEAEETPAEVFGRMIDAFAVAAVNDAPRYDCSGWENVLTMAAVEAAYLSDRTAQAEDPADLLSGYGVTEQDCRKLIGPDNSSEPS